MSTVRNLHTSLLLFIAVGVGVLLLGCRSTSAESVEVIEVGAGEFTFSAPQTVQAGRVTLRLTNYGQEPHHAQLIRLNDGVSYDQFATALMEKGEAAVPALATLVGGVGAVSENGSADVTADLTPGTYVLACFVPSADGQPHFAKGMMKPLVVTGQAMLASPPESSDTFTMADFTFEMPDSLPAGPATYRVVNAGEQPHELNLLKLEPGKTLADVQAWEAAPSGPPPYQAVGGINGISPGGEGYMELNLPPGDYIAVCKIPDPASGEAHSHLGMIKGFTVR